MALRHLKLGVIRRLVRLLVALKLSFACNASVCGGGGGAGACTGGGGGGGGGGGSSGGGGGGGGGGGPFQAKVEFSSILTCSFRKIMP